ncbi:uncharacterized protein EV420DRAFT_1728262 [Desarmillaria tabescens]|uniref:Uncharacterized protein n=1 Tax=Armillaria tabescens TaxID=1929756 RepID=A0AA39TU20_ARMTA|nr:uncharacterized protein EV420DRAFT_1728262 [Desarmillaria tabescens]KAK0463514.1 hypothetical protein EV420DRAFT_1728262 [Desarmillaria tabescens]
MISFKLGDVELALAAFQFTVSSPLSIVVLIFFLFRLLVLSQMPFAWALREIRRNIEETHKLFNEQNRVMSLPEDFVVLLVNLEEKMCDLEVRWINARHQFFYTDPRSWLPFLFTARRIWKDVCKLRFRVDLLNIRLRMSIAGRRRGSVVARRGSLGF